MLTLPDFLGIGAPQSATTWLYKNLKLHLDVFMSQVKEIHYFDRNFAHSLFWYANHFKNGKTKLKGEITPGYGILSMEMIKYVRRIMPALKLIYIVRNPVDQRLSAARRFFSTLSNDPFVEIPEKEIFEFLSQQKDNNGNYTENVRRYDHYVILKNWLSVFPREQLHICFFEDVVNRPQLLLEGVFRFLNVSNPKEWDHFLLHKKINSNPNIDVPEKYIDYMKEQAKDGIEELYQILKSPVVEKWKY